MKNKLIFCCLLGLLAACSPNYFKKYAATEARWKKEVSELVALDKTESDPSDGILFIGSSSIRLWKNIHQDMLPYQAIRRGYGGASFSDLIHFTDDLVYPHQFKALVVFVANDITGSADDRTPEEVLGLAKTVVKTVRRKYPNVPIFQVSITPTPSRWKVWTKQKEANELMKSYFSGQKNLYFIDTEAAYLNAKGEPRAELFIGDNLHQKQQGYDLWASLIKQSLDAHLK
ncbi:MAG: GDSL-type esterase/lipase family protein [Spirosomataceae bacterium]